MERWKMIEPLPGDHIRVHFKEFYHHGIYIGDDRVIQFGLASDVFKPACEIKVLESSMADFLKGGFVEVRQYTKSERKKLKKPCDIIAYAKSKLGTDGYNILHNNCEHFATECTTGIRESTQIDIIRQFVTNLREQK